MNEIQTYRLVVTGPESTGKTTLSRQLAGYFNGRWVPEYARKYAEKLERPYSYKDVEHIAKQQISQAYEYIEGKGVVVFDTYLIITKVWFEWGFGSCPDFVINEIRKNSMNLYLLCYPDIEWEPDAVREFPGKERFELFRLYQENFEQFHLPYKIVKGQGPQRFRNALLALSL